MLAFSLNSDGPGFWNWVLRPEINARNGLNTSWTRLIFGALHFEKSSKMAKIWQKMKKSLVQLTSNPFLHRTAGTQNPGFDYSFQRSSARVFLYLLSNLFFYRERLLSKYWWRGCKVHLNFGANTYSPQILVLRMYYVFFVQKNRETDLFL